jgi:hypothetical protein
MNLARLCNTGSSDGNRMGFFDRLFSVRGSERAGQTAESNSQGVLPHSSDRASELSVAALLSGLTSDHSGIRAAAVKCLESTIGDVRALLTLLEQLQRPNEGVETIIEAIREVLSDNIDSVSADVLVQMSLFKTVTGTAFNDGRESHTYEVDCSPIRQLAMAALDRRRSVPPLISWTAC